MNYCNEAHTVGLAVNQQRIRPSQIPSEQKRTSANGNRNKRTQCRPINSPYALVWRYLVREPAGSFIKSNNNFFVYFVGQQVLNWSICFPFLYVMFQIIGLGIYILFGLL
jgi:hypothetical protein